MSLPAPLVERIHARVGTFLRRKYRLDRLLGIGGSACVYQAMHRNGTAVALKLLHPELAMLPELRARFLREGYVANRIAHPSVVRIIDDDDADEDRTVFLVMELLEGESLDARWERQRRRLPLDEVLSHADRLLDVLTVAHTQGIVHRDLKPENLFVTRFGELKVLDFGIARLLDGSGATVSGQVLGTPAFMPPEQAGGRVREVDPRSDLWSVGALLFALITGEHVHAGRSVTEQLVFAATQPARPLRGVAAWVPTDVADVIDKALAFDRARRWQDARSMQTAVRGTRTYDVLSATAFDGSSSATPSRAEGIAAQTAPTLPHGSSGAVRGPAADPFTGTVAFDLTDRKKG